MIKAISKHSLLSPFIRLLPDLRGKGIPCNEDAILLILCGHCGGHSVMWMLFARYWVCMREGSGWATVIF